MASKLKLTGGKARAITSEEALYNMIDKMGETLDGSLHIIDTGDGGECYEQSYRVYHSAGYCFDVYKEDATDEQDKETKYYYGFYSEWPEFATLSVSDALRLFQDTIIVNDKAKIKKIADRYHDIQCMGGKKQA